MDNVEVLRAVWRITEWRDNTVYRTEYVEDKWVPMNSPEGRMATVGDLQYGSPSKSQGPTIRRKPVGE
jgi:hypothetical protein